MNTAHFLLCPCSMSDAIIIEANEVHARLKTDNDDLAEYYGTKFIKHAFMDWKIWMQAM